jgi:hypothetical protein
MTTNTVRLHRVLRAPPERVYRALLDAEAMAKWLPPNGFTGKVHHLKAEVGGTYKMSFTNFTSGHSHSFGGNTSSSSRTSASSHRQVRRSELVRRNEDNGVTEEGVLRHGARCRAGRHTAAIPAEACYLGWQESLVLLAQLVEAEIPG